MKVLIVGGGGREHALAWAAAKSPDVEKVFVAPGNAGTAMEPGCENVAISAGDIEGLIGFAREQGIELTIAGPEDPLVNGIVDRFHEAGLKCFGPRAAAAQLEGSKAFAKDFMARHGIPTAAYGTFSEIDPAIAFIREQGAPIVVKADGLAAGKGVIVCETTGEAESAVQDMLAGNAFGDAGHRVVIEEFLEGEEASFIVMADGRNILPLATSQDHKAAGDGDTGPNTGGMGAYSPAPVVTSELFDQVMKEIMIPTVQAMASEGRPYKGVLYAGLMIKDGRAKVLEFNARFGDPEAQPLFMRMDGDLVDIMEAVVDERLDTVTLDWQDDATICVVMASARLMPLKMSRSSTQARPRWTAESSRPAEGCWV
jgi:phosphoribosylamine--glycine ligase